MYSYSLGFYENVVRTGAHHNEPDIINYYVHLGLQQAQQCQSAQQTKRIHLRVLQTLEEVMCDGLIAKPCRERCFRNIQRLKPLIFEMMDEREYQNYTTRIEALYQYFLNKPDSAHQSQSYQQSTVAAQGNKGSSKGDLK